MALMTMENLFKKVNLIYQELEINKFYDIRDKKLKIKSYNHKKKKNEYRQIEGLFYKGTFPIWRIELKDGSILLKGNENHKVFNTIKNDYDSLKDSTEISVFFENGESQIAYIKKTDEIDHIVDLQVEGNENYFSNDILSHNTGGEKPKFAASVVNRVQKMDTIKDGNDTIGISLRVRNYKNKTGIPFRDANMKLYFNGGFNPAEEYLDFVISFGIIEQKGAFFYIPGVEKAVQGRAKVQTWLDEHPEEYQKMKDKVDEMMLHENILDENKEEIDELTAEGKESIDEEISEDLLENE